MCTLRSHRHRLFPPPFLHPRILPLRLPVQKRRDAVVQGLQRLGRRCRYLDGWSLAAHDREVIPSGLVGVLYASALVEDLGAADVKLLDLDREGAVSSLGFLDGDVVLGLRPVHVQDVWLPQHIPHHNVLGLPLARARGRLRFVIIVLNHTLSLGLHDPHLLARHVKLHGHRTGRDSHGLDGLVGMLHALSVDLEQHVSQADAGGVGGAPVDGEGDDRTIAYGLDEGGRRGLVQRAAKLPSRGEDGAEHGSRDARIVVRPSLGEAALVQGDGNGCRIVGGTILVGIVVRIGISRGNAREALLALGGRDVALLVEIGIIRDSGGGGGVAEAHVVPEVSVIVRLILLPDLWPKRSSRPGVIGKRIGRGRRGRRDRGSRERIERILHRAGAGAQRRHGRHAALSRRSGRAEARGKGRRHSVLGALLHHRHGPSGHGAVVRRRSVVGRCRGPQRRDGRGEGLGGHGHRAAAAFGLGGVLPLLLDGILLLLLMLHLRLLVERIELMIGIGGLLLLLLTVWLLMLDEMIIRMILGRYLHGLLLLLAILVVGIHTRNVLARRHGHGHVFRFGRFTTGRSCRIVASCVRLLLSIVAGERIQRKLAEWIQTTEVVVNHGVW
mmetsp:Transcript_3731/g.9504  ORF Transcript_3731/g.9504 Transcript_3731/m.9504 type:complete len:612 (-) Transcript_3731:113-1948(-)